MHRGMSTFSGIVLQQLESLPGFVQQATCLLGMAHDASGSRENLRGHVFGSPNLKRASERFCHSVAVPGELFKGCQ